jgi:hypothetical protein
MQRLFDRASIHKKNGYQTYHRQARQYNQTESPSRQAYQLLGAGAIQ